MFKRVFYAILILIILTASTACSSTAANKNIYTATIQANSFYIMSEINGKIKDISINQGDSIKEGQSILKLDSTLYQLQKKQAAAALKITEASESGLPKMAKDSQKEQAKAAIDQAQASVDIAELQIDRCNIISEGNGIVEDVYVNKGEIVSAGMNIARVMDLSSKYLKIYVEESKRNNVKLGLSIPLYINNKLIGNGTIVYVSSESEFTPKNVETKSEKDKTVFEVKIKLDSNIDAAPGAMVDVEIK